MNSIFMNMMRHLSLYIILIPMGLYQGLSDVGTPKACSVGVWPVLISFFLVSSFFLEWFFNYILIDNSKFILKDTTFSFSQLKCLLMLSFILRLHIMIATSYYLASVSPSFNTHVHY